MVYPASGVVLARARAERMAWLLRLRWMALGGVLVGVLLAQLLGVQGINIPVLLVAILGGALYNAWFERALRDHPERVGDPLHHALADFGALTLVLWASGGVHNPYLSLAFVHVLLVSVLGDRRAFLLACTGVLACAAFLLSVEVIPWLQISRLEADRQVTILLGVSAFVVTVVASAYVASRAQAELALRRQEAAAAKRARERNVEILHSAVDRLDVGLEILAPDGTPTYQNRHLLERHGHETVCRKGKSHCDATGERCPVEDAREGIRGSCRFSMVDGSGRERVIEMLCFPLADEKPAPVLRLHIDRTENFLAERRLLFAERLASLGRTVQAVAHELNTPLATIQTLAADMRTALQMAPPGFEAVVRDLDESASLILEEMQRCRSITQGLLAGRDRLSGGSRHGPCEVGPAVERAATLVFGANRSRSRLVVEPALRTASAVIDSDSLVQVFVNLLQNALDVIESDPQGKVWMRLGEEAPEGRVAIEIYDNGPGLAPGTSDRIFEAFYTTKPPGQGTGLGLYTARSLLQEAGGTLRLERAPTGGALARIELPRVMETDV